MCNHPSLCDVEESAIPEELLDSTYEEQGSKLAVVSHLLHSLRQNSSEKIVLVSISTQVLDILAELCDHYQYPYLRLDGSSSTNHRQNVVSRFNAPYSNDFVLLLSSKAGGTGLNLIGASRILLYDMDWNPAHDLQAMARVWRDGQTKPVTVYRLATTGTIEEKIFQRQITKQGLGGGLVEDSRKATKFHFTQEELRDLFSFNRETNCDTHDLLGCDCQGDGGNVDAQEVTGRSCQLGGGEDQIVKSGVGMKDLLQWKHIEPPVGNIPDDSLAGAMQYVTFALMNSHQKSQNTT